MDVTCERCGTEYEFDETLVAARGTTVKCTNCGHLFKVFRPGSAAASSAPDNRAWSIRRAGGGPSESIASLKDLQRRITLGELTPDDEISRSGEGWKRLGDIAELQTFFAAARAARGERRDPTGSVRRDPTPAPPPRRDPTGPTSTRRDPTGGGRAFAPTIEAPSTERPPPPEDAPRRGGKSTMLGMGGLASNAPPAHATHQAPGHHDEVRGRTLEMAVPPPAAGAPPPAPPPRSSSGSVSAPRPMPEGRTGAGTLRAPSARPPAPPRAAPPSTRPPPVTGAAPPPPRPLALDAADMSAPPRQRSSAASSSPPGRSPSMRPLRVDDDDDTPALPRGRSRSGLWVALVLLLAIGGGVAAGWDRIAALVSGGEPTDPAAPFVAAGDEALRLDHADAYEDAIGQYTRALAFREHDARALTGLARAHALIAQHHVFQASDLEARAGDDAALRGEAATLRRTAADHAADAREHAEAAARHGGDADAEIALSDALRLAGDPTLARSRLDRARTLRSEPSAEGLRVEAMLTADQAGNVAAARALAERAVAEDPGLLRVRLLLARAQLAAGDVAAAQAQLQAVLDRVADHPEALALRAAITDGRPPAAPVVGGDAGLAAATTVAAPPQVAPVAPVAPPSSTTPSSTAPEVPAAARSYDALVREAEQRLENGDNRRARSLYEQALRERPGAPEATTGMGFVMLADGNARGALSQFQSAADRGYADALIGVGDAHRRLGQREEALAAYERYLERSPTGPRASIARRQADRLRAELGASAGGAGGGTSAAGGTPPQTGEGATGGGGEPPAREPPASDTPETAAEELPAPRGTTAPPPSDVPAIDSEP